MKRLRPVLFGVAIIITASAIIPFAAIAQTPSGPSRRSRPVTVLPGFGPAGNTIAPKAHAPLSAVLVQHSEQTLSDGTNITRDMEETVMRDGEGRIYRGREIKLPRGHQTEPHMMVTISDPVRHVQYVCTPIKICRKMEYRADVRQPRLPAPRRMPGITVENLGSSNINGVEVEGTRVTRVIPEGQAGNDRPITSTEELWRSNELGLDVQVTRTDPRAGTRTTTMTQLSLGEPDPRYFQIPEGYRVEERRGQVGAMSPILTESDSSYLAPPMPPGSLPPNP